MDPLYSVISEMTAMAGVGDSNRVDSVVTEPLLASQPQAASAGGSVGAQYSLPPGGSRPLEQDEVDLAQTVFGNSIDYAEVTIHREQYWVLQPEDIAMAPDGDIWFHPEGSLYNDNFGTADLSSQGLFMHEMTHVYQYQSGTNVAVQVVISRTHEYELTPGKPLGSYLIEQQGDIVRDYFFLLNDSGGGPAFERYRLILPF